MTRRAYHLREARAIARNALDKGAVLTSPVDVQWNAAGSCSDPKTVELLAKLDPIEDFRDERPISTTMFVRCRKCPACLRARSVSWQRRAIQELALAQRSWFGTLTLSDAEQIKYLYRAQLAAKRRALSWESPLKRAPDESPGAYGRRCDQWRFTRICRAIGPDITKWLKRVRKESDAKLRFLLVAEAHKSGRPHYHILIHEVAGSNPIRKRTLDGQWKLGFSQFRLVQEGERAARYVCKYLTKSVLARVRASIRYGSTASALEETMFLLEKNLSLQKGGPGPQE